MQDIDQILSHATQAIKKADNVDTLEHIRVTVLGKKGSLTQLVKGLAALPPSERPWVGQAVNQVKQKIQKLGDRERQILEYLLLENRRVTEHELVTTHKVHQQSPEIKGLCQYGFLEQSTSQYSSMARTHSIFWYQIHPNYRQILEEVIFEESTDTSEKER